MKLKIGILNLGINNLKSLLSFFSKFGDVSLINEKKDYKNFDILILPGNGSFYQGRQIINEKKYADIILKHLEYEKKLIGICLGMQLLFTDSEESTDVKGLNLIKGSVKKIKSQDYKLPLLGWYEILSKKKTDINKKTFFFNNNYSVFPNDIEISKAFIENDGQSSISAIVKKNNIYGLQFHPEKSSHNGFNLVNKILKDEF